MTRVPRAAGAGLLALVTLLAACTSSATPTSPPRVSARTGGTTSSTNVQRAGSPARRAPASADRPAGPRTAAPRTATILGSGDVLIHPPLWQQAHADAVAAGRSGYDFGPMYAGIARDVAGTDLATCEMETPLARPQGPFSGWPNFNAPPQVLTALKGIGYRSCTTATNHTIDQGYAGVRRTLDALDEAGLRHTGSARSAAEAAKPTIVTTSAGVRIAQLAYAFGFNGIPVPAATPWLANRTDVPTILAAAHRARAAGADIVVVSMHWGTEYDHLATAEQQAQARRLLASPDVDLILGDHVHVVQPAQRLHGKWVFYGMGNQISRHADPIAAGREGVMPRVTFTEVSPHHFRATLAEAVATWMQDEPDLRLLDISRALTGSGQSLAQRADERTAHTRITGYLDTYGAVSEGLVIR